MSLQDTLCQSYQSNQPYRSYPKPDKKEVYQVNDKTMKDLPENFYTIFDEDREDVAYSDKSFDEDVVNFVRIETFCSKCHSSFPLRSKLHKHTKAGYVREALPSSSIQPSLSIQVIASMIVH